MDPQPNAYTSGDTRPFVVVNSGLIDLLRPEELKAVIAHECGHILCHHVLYHTLATHLLTISTGFFSDLKSIVTAPLKWALLYWVRRSEFSADRVSAYVMEDSGVVVNTMMRLAGGKSEITRNVNIEEFIQQAISYYNDLDESKFSKFLQAIAIKDQTHPFAAIRALEVRKWYYETHQTLPKPTEYDQLYQSIKIHN
jgi:Zn-dependent protease with chaperone function